MQKRRGITDKYSYGPIGGCIKDHIIFFAILLSLAVHVFWLSVVTIIAPKKTPPVKFSKVAFLGPILTRGAIDIRMEPKPRSLLEKRYLDIITNYPVGKNSQGKDSHVLYKEEQGFDSSKNAMLPGLIDEAISGSKLEPLDL